MKLIFDIGNTTTKAAIFSQKELIDEIRLEELNLSDIESFVGSNKIISSIISCVNNENKEIINEVSKIYNSFLFTYKSQIPINSLYSTPETLGLDRIAGVVGASILFPGKDILIFDLGTCLTIDYIDSKKTSYCFFEWIYLEDLLRGQQQ